MKIKMALMAAAALFALPMAALASPTLPPDSKVVGLGFNETKLGCADAYVVVDKTPVIIGAINIPGLFGAMDSVTLELAAADIDMQIQALDRMQTTLNMPPPPINIDVGTIGHIIQARGDDTDPNFGIIPPKQKGSKLKDAGHLSAAATQMTDQITRRFLRHGDQASYQT